MCEDIVIDSLDIINPTYGPNTDGLDIDCCKRVCISNCNIIGGDDAIALKSDSGRYGDEEFPLEDITVTNCVLCTRVACGVRIGYEGDSVLRNCTLSNLTIRDASVGIDLVSILPDHNNMKLGSRIENITFDNIVMRNVNKVFGFSLASHWFVTVALVG